MLWPRIPSKWPILGLECIKLNETKFFQDCWVLASKPKEPLKRRFWTTRTQLRPVFLTAKIPKCLGTSQRTTCKMCMQCVSCTVHSAPCMAHTTQWKWTKQSAQCMIPPTMGLLTSVQNFKIPSKRFLFSPVQGWSNGPEARALER